jgi:hypothetical protein
VAAIRFIGAGNAVELDLQLRVDGLQLLVHGLQLFLARFQLLCGRAVLLIDGLQFLVGGAKLLIGGLELLAACSQARSCQLQLFLEMMYRDGRRAIAFCGFCVDCSRLDRIALDKENHGLPGA